MCGYSKDTSLADLEEDGTVCFSQIPSLTPDSFPHSRFLPSLPPSLSPLSLTFNTSGRSSSTRTKMLEPYSTGELVESAATSRMMGTVCRWEEGREGRRVRLSLVFVIRGREGVREGGTERTFRLAPRRLALKGGTKKSPCAPAP